MAGLAALACAAAGLALFQFFGNATRGYVDTPSVFWWWISQWLDPQAEAEHGWLILGLSAWLFARNLRAKERAVGARRSERGDRSSGRARSEGGDGSPSRPSGASGEGGESKGGRLGEASLPAMAGRDAAEPEGGAATPFAAGDGVGASRRGAESAPYLAMIAALALHAVGFVAQQTRVSIVALLLFTWGVVRLAGGRRVGDAAKFPLGFMVFAIPVSVLDSVGFWLRLWVIDAAGVIARVAGIDVVRSGTQLFAPDGRYQYDVAAACSGVRSLLALLALSLFIGYLEFRSTRRRVLMLLLCFPLTYLGNVARIAAIVWAAQLGGQAWGERAHDVMGYGVFVIVLGGVLLAARVVQRWWPEKCHPLYDTMPGAGGAGAKVRGSGGEREADGEARTEERTRNAERVGRDGAAGRAVVILGLLIVVLAVGEMVFLGRMAARPGDGAAGVRLSAEGKDPVALPAFIGTEWIGRRAEVTEVERAVLPADTGFSRRNYVEVQGGAHAVFVSVVLSGRDRTSIHRPELCLVGQGWTIRGQAAHAFTWPGDSGARVPATLLRTEQVDRATGRRVPALVAYWFVNRDTVVATHLGRFWHDAWNRLRGRRDRWAYVLVQTDALDGEAPALARMQAVLDGTLPAFQVVR